MSNHANTQVWRDNLETKLPLGKMVAGIDVGGTTINVDAFRCVGDRVTEEVIFGFQMNTPKGPRGLLEAYSRILRFLLENSAKDGVQYMLMGVGVGTPGTYIEPAFIKPGEVPRGESRKVAALTADAPWRPSKLNMLAHGSAKFMWRQGHPDDFGNVELEPAMQRSTPRGVQVAAENDALAQRDGFVMRLREDARTRHFIEKKKVMYLGHGTGLGTAVRNGDGENPRYGYYQEMQLFKRAGDAYGEALFDTVYGAAVKREKGAPEDQRLYSYLTPPAIQAEDVLSGTGFGQLLATIVTPDILPLDEKGKFDLAGFDALWRDPEQRKRPEIQVAGRYLEAAGRYMGDMLTQLYTGDYTALDPAREQGEAFRDAAGGFQTLILGGGMSGAAFYREIVLKQAKAVLRERGLAGAFDIVLPENPNLAATYAAACQVTKETIAQNPYEMAARMHDESWRKAGRLVIAR